MIRTILDIIRSILGALQIWERIPFISKKPTIEILEPQKIIIPDPNKAYTHQPIKGKVNYCKTKSKVWLLGLLNNESSNNKLFPQNETKIRIENDGTWEGRVFFQKHDKIKFYAVLVEESSTLDKLFEYYFNAEKHYNRKYGRNSNNRDFFGIDQSILDKCETVTYIKVAQ